MYINALPCFKFSSMHSNGVLCWPLYAEIYTFARGAASAYSLLYAPMHMCRSLPEANMLVVAAEAPAQAPAAGAVPAPSTVTTQLTAPAPVAAAAPVSACLHCRSPNACPNVGCGAD